MKAITARALLVLVPLMGCGAANSVVPITRVAVVEAASDVFPSETTLVLSDEVSWQNLWTAIYANVSPAPPLPVIDFNHDVLLVAATGTCESSGCKANIAGATESAGSVTVYVTFTGPGAGCVPNYTESSQVYIASIPRRGTVHFKVINEPYSCGCTPGTLFCD